MSVIDDQIRYLDSQLDRAHLLTSLPIDELSGQILATGSSPRSLELKKIIKTLSITSSSSILSSSRILALLEQASLPDLKPEKTNQDLNSLHENDLYWLLVSKATIHIYGLLLDSLFRQIIPLNKHIWYWDKVLSSNTNLSLFAIQTTPRRLWFWLKDIYYDAKSRFARFAEPSEFLYMRDIRSDYVGKWKGFYNLVRRSIREKSIQDLQLSVLSPLARCRAEAQCNQLKLKRLKEMGASGLGVLIVNGFKFDIDESTDIAKRENKDNNKYRIIMERSVALMDNVLKNVLKMEMGVMKFEDTIFTNITNDPEISVMGEDDALVTRPARLNRRLRDILKVLIPSHNAVTERLVHQYGRPSRPVRFWLPTCVLLLSTPILQLGFGKREVIRGHIQNMGITARDFYFNWVLEPIKKVICTIRHDRSSELALMSKESLSGDRDSLERMVVDFAIDNSQSTGRISSLTESQLSEIRAKVREGDLTPVLRAYEKDLRNPLRGTLRGDLVRALLIQVQKTKVDVEIAMSGIDALLKSQELVFGFVGLTPGLAICFAIFRYLRGAIRNMMGLRNDHKSGQTIRILRNIDRILTLAIPTQNNLLSHKDHGLLLCDVHRLRKYAHKLFPSEIEREFLEDVSDLCNINGGLSAQLNALKRIRWDYSKWIK